MADFLLGGSDIPLTKGSIRLKSNPNDKLTFEFNPATLNVDSTVTWVKQKIPGKHHPILQYAGGEGRVITFQLELYSLRSGVNDVERQIAWLQGLTYPDIRGDELANREPPRCLLFLGRYKTYNVVVESAKVTHREMYRNMLTRYALVDMTFIEDEPDAVGYLDLRPELNP